MSGFKSLSESLDADMRITLGGGHGRMTKELLDNSHVGTSFQDMSRGRVSKGVRRQTVAGGCLS
jgi:hypothetical protein